MISMNEENLIIDSYRSEIVTAIKQYRIVFIRGQSGCGKSTKVPQFIVEDLFQSRNEQVYVLLNQTLAVRALSDYMSEKLQGRFSVGHYYKGDCSKTKNPHISYVISSWFARQMNSLGKVNSNFIIIDDIHRISFQVNIILYKMINYLKQNMNRRLILMSSFLNVKLFDNFFKYFECKFIDIKPVCSNIEIIYFQRNDDELINQIARQVTIICQEDNNSKDDHILILVSGIKNLRNVGKAIRELHEYGIIDCCNVIECVSLALPQEKIKVLQVTDFRKIIIATLNIRNGIKMPGLKYLIDYSSNSNKANFANIINAENRKGLLGHSNKGAKCFRFYDNPFSLIFPEFIKHEINTNITEGYVNLILNLLFDVLIKRKHFIVKFYTDFDNYFEKSMDINHNNLNVWDGFGMETLKHILSLIYPNIHLVSYKSMLDILKIKIIDYYEDKWNNYLECTFTGKKINESMRLTWLLLVNKINDVYRFPYIHQPQFTHIDMAVKRLLNLSLIKWKGEDLIFTQSANFIKDLRITMSKAKLIYIAYIVEFPGPTNFYEEICSICELSRNKLDFSTFNVSPDDDDGDIFRYYNARQIWINNSTSEIFQNHEFQYLKEEIGRTTRYFYSRRYTHQNEIQISHSKFDWRTWIKWLILSGYVHEIAVKVDTDEEDGCDVFHVLSDEVDAKINEKSCVDLNNLQIILFMEMKIYPGDKKFPYRLNDITRISYEELCEFNPQIFQINEDFWHMVLEKVESLLHKNSL